MYNELNPLVRHFNVTGLTTGQLYFIKVSAVNFNGESELSEPLQKYSCRLPGKPDRPFRVGGTSSSIDLRWSVPLENGGCNITGFQLYRDDGQAGLISTEVDAASIRDRPHLTQHSVVLDESLKGKQIRFQLKVINLEGSQFSSIAAFIIADVPDKPQTVPEKV